MATYLIALLAVFFPTALFPIGAESASKFLLLIFLMTFVLPAFNISFFRIFGVVKSFAMEERRERIAPFILITVLYAAVTYLFFTKSRVSLDDSLLKLLMIIDAMVLMATVVTLFYKVSVHALASCGIIGILLPLNKAAENNALFLPTILAIIIAGLVMSARLQLNAHTPREVLVGAVTGFSVGFFGMIILF